jgi:hypothetical protein
VITPQRGDRGGKLSDLQLITIPRLFFGTVPQAIGEICRCAS